MMALDGTLWVEDGKPYMVYCHEWVELGDGTMELIELTPDLSKTIVPSKVLFNGSRSGMVNGYAAVSRLATWIRH